MSDALRAAFSRGPVTVDVDGIRFSFPHATASEWVTCLASAHWHADLFRRADPASYEAFLDRAEEGRAGARELSAVAHAALTAAAGRPWWEAERLVYVLADPSLLGAVLRTGADPDRLTLAGFLAVVYSVLVTGQDTAGRMKIDSELSVPPPEAAGEGDDDLSSVVASLRSMPGVRVR